MISYPVVFNKSFDHIGNFNKYLANAIADAEIFDGQYCKYGSHSNNDSSEIYYI